MSLHLCSSLLVFLTQLRFVERVKGVTCSRGFYLCQHLSSLHVPFCATACSGTCWQMAWQPPLDFSGARELTAFAEQ